MSFPQAPDEVLAPASEVLASVEKYLETPRLRSLTLSTSRDYPGSQRQVRFNPHRFFFLVLKGTARLETAETGEIRRLQPGDAALFGPETWHTLERSSGCSAFRVSMRDDETRFGLRIRPALPLRSCSVNRPISSLIRDCFDRALEAGEEGWALAYSEILLRELILMLRASPRRPASKAAHTWGMLREYVERNCHQTIDRTQVGEAVGLHPSHLSRLYQNFSGQTFQQHLEACRLERAEALLVHSPHLSIAEVAARTGFSSHAYFSKVFRARAGQSPTGYRSRLKIDRRGT